MTATARAESRGSMVDRRMQPSPIMPFYGSGWSACTAFFANLQLPTDSARIENCSWDRAMVLILHQLPRLRNRRRDLWPASGSERRESGVELIHRSLNGLGAPEVDLDSAHALYIKGQFVVP